MMNNGSTLPLNLEISYPLTGLQMERFVESSSKSDLGLSAFSDDFLPFSYDYFTDASSNLHQSKSSEKFEKEQSKSEEHSPVQSTHVISSSISLNSTSTSLV